MPRETNVPNSQWDSEGSLRRKQVNSINACLHRCNGPYNVNVLVVSVLILLYSFFFSFFLCTVACPLQPRYVTLARETVEWYSRARWGRKTILHWFNRRHFHALSPPCSRSLESDRADRVANKLGLAEIGFANSRESRFRSARPWSLRASNSSGSVPEIRSSCHHCVRRRTLCWRFT